MLQLKLVGILCDPNAFRLDVFRFLSLCNTLLSQNYGLRFHISLFIQYPPFSELRFAFSECKGQIPENFRKGIKVVILQPTKSEL